MLVIGIANLDLLAENRAAEIGDGHPGGKDGAAAADVGDDAALIAEDPDDDLVAGRLRLRGACKTDDHEQRDERTSHGTSFLI